MARGTAAGEPVVSQASTAEFRDSYDRIFGDRPPVRGKWVWDEAQQKLVSADEYVPPARAQNAPIMVDRFMEGAVSAEGEDIGSRRKREEYKRRHGVVDSSDVSKEWIAKRREESDRSVTERTQRTVQELANVERHNLRNAVDALKRKP